MAECPACGRETAPGEVICPDCGTRLEGVTESFPPIVAELEVEAIPVESAEGPVLIVRKGHDVGERFYVDRPSLTIGRDPASDIFLNDVTVSRHHAKVEHSGGEFAIRDVGSLNGTYVNGVLVDSAVLSRGDIVQIGTFQMVFTTGGDAQ